jgi:hypothetical protein
MDLSRDGVRLGTQGQTLIFKCIIIINGFLFTSNTVIYLQTHGLDFRNPKVLLSNNPDNFD